MHKIRLGFIAVLLCALCAAAAQAADVVCVQPNALGGDDPYSIMQATLDNGQVIYYISMEDDPRFQMADVNFDGHDDFVPVISMGASNFFVAFFVYNPQTALYEPVQTVERGFCNYTLVPEKGYVVSSVNDGVRHRDVLIYQWQNGALQLLRRGTVAGLRSVEYDTAGMVERWDFSRSEIVIYDYTAGVEGGQLIFQEAFPDDDPQYEEHLTLFETKLWEGL